MVATLRDGLWVHPSWLARAMSGYTSCFWAPWYRTRYKDWARPGGEPDWTMFRIAHTRMLNELRSERLTAGDTVLQEGQGAFRIRRPSGLTISGQPDLIAIAGQKATVYEAKSGRRSPVNPIQVLIYMHCLRISNRGLRDFEISGEIRYDDGDPPIVIPAADALGEFESHFEYFMRMLEDPRSPDRVPSVGECRFCNIASPDCPDRMEGEVRDSPSQLEDPF